MCESGLTESLERPSCLFLRMLVNNSLVSLPEKAFAEMSFKSL